MNFKDIEKKCNRKIYTLSGVWKLRESVRYVPACKRAAKSEDSKSKRLTLRIKSSKNDRVY
jgi:hypothetical protein